MELAYGSDELFRVSPDQLQVMGKAVLYAANPDLMAVLRQYRGPASLLHRRVAVQVVKEAAANPFIMEMRGIKEQKGTLVEKPDGGAIPEKRYYVGPKTMQETVFAIRAVARHLPGSYRERGEQIVAEYEQLITPAPLEAGEAPD